MTNPNFNLQRLIGFCGTGGTGKTTTMKALAERTGYPIIPSASRETQKAFGITTEHDQVLLTPEQSIKLQFQIQHNQAQKILQALMHHPHEQYLISDRTPVDHAAYNLFRNSLTLKYAECSDISEHLREHLFLFKHIFYFPPYVYGTDTFRQSSEGYTMVHDYIIRGLLEDFNVSYNVMPLGTVEERVSHIMRIISLGPAA